MAARFWVGGTGTWDASDTSHWSTTSGGGTGASVPGSGDTVTMDASSGGGTVTLGYSPTVTSITMGAFTGTFAGSTYSPTMQTMSNSGTGTRTLDMGSGVWTLTGNNTSIYSAAVADNLTVSNKSDFQCTYSGSTGTRTVTTGSTSGATEANTVGFNFTAGSDIISTAGSGFVGNFIFGASFTGSLANNTRTVYGNLIISSGMTVTAGSNTVTLGATSGTKTITTNGVTIDHPITITAPGGSYVLGDNFTLGTTRSFNVANGSFDASGFTFTTGNFVSTNTNTRTITMGSGQWTVTNSGTTVWSCADLTNCTFTPGLSVIFNYSGSTGTRTITHGSSSATGTETNSISIKVTAGTDIVTHASTSTFKNYDFTGFSGSIASVSITIYGSITFSATQTVTGGTGIYTLAATSGTQTITTNGITTDRAVTVNAPGGTIKFQDGWTGSTRGFVFTAGSIDDNSSTISFGTFTSSAGNTRNWIQSGTWNIVNSGATIWNTGNLTGFTITQTGTINFTYSGSVGTRTIASATSGNGATESNAISIKITAGTDAISLTTGRTWKSIDFTGFSGSWTPTAETIYGGLILSSAMTCVTAAVTLTFSATSGTQTITTNSNTTFGTGMTSVTINAPGGTYQWGSAFTALCPLTLTAGTLNFNNYNTSSTTLSSSNSNVRTLTMGSGTYTLTGTGTVWSTATTTNLTFNAGTSTIVMNDASSSSKTMAGGALTYNNITMSGAGTGTFIMGTTTTTMTVNTWTVSNAPHTVQIFEGKTINATSLVWSGTAGNLNTFQSTTNGTAWFINVASGTIAENYISLQDSSAAGGATFYAGTNSTNVSNNTGWIFTNVPLSGGAQNASHDENDKTTLLGTYNLDGITPVRVKVNPSNHALKIQDGTDGLDYGDDNANIDENSVSTLIGVSSADGVTPINVYCDSNGNLLIDSV